MPSITAIIERLGATRTCDANLTSDPWSMPSAASQYGPGASARDGATPTAPRRSSIPMQSPIHVQPPIPDRYTNASADDLRSAIIEARHRLGDRVLVLGHFYQRDEIIEHADFVGDSFQLARNAADRPDVDHIVFCGVHFMAETADILSTPDQTVTLPNMAAGCSMADMASIDQVEHCWNRLTGICGTEPDADGLRQIIPVTYMNSSAAIKAFCGRHGGIVCTSSNARSVLEWSYRRGRRVLFLPDQHLGRNTALAMGIPPERMAMWNPMRPDGGTDERSYAAASIILWKGFCSVHQRFTVEQIERAQRAYPGVRVVVHPECSKEVVEAADGVGSTAYIVHEIERAPAGSAIAVGTEINLVNRLATQHPDKTVFCLDPVVCPCSTMYRIHPAYLAWALDGLVAGTVVNRITVDPGIAHDAKTSLTRMLEVHP